MRNEALQAEVSRTRNELQGEIDKLGEQIELRNQKETGYTTHYCPTIMFSHDFLESCR